MRNLVNILSRESQICPRLSSPRRLEIESRSRVAAAGISSIDVPVRFTTVFILVALCCAAEVAHAGLAQSPVNGFVLEQIKKMPSGGKYSASSTATLRLQSAVQLDSGKLSIAPEIASPSYCSGATYLVFLNTIEALRDRGYLELNNQTLDRFFHTGALTELQ